MLKTNPDLLDERDERILLTLAACNLNVSEVANRLYMHRNTVTYHTEKVKRLTGLDPRDFYDLHKLLTRMKRGGLNRGKK